MTIENVSQLITTLGFPICMCGALFWYMVEQNKIHKADSDGMREAINELRVAIVKLCDKIAGGDS